jgi:tRNA pseudouridine55 synthase
MRNAARNCSINGILNVDKPLGLTSHDIVARIRRLAKQRKVGHAGTLDPLATGVLLICLGQATRVSQQLMDSVKAYQAVVRLGISTTTLDTEGEITNEEPVAVTSQQVEAVLEQFVGRVKQVPPMYSALKRNGKKLYALARQGITVERQPREIDIYGLKVTAWALPRIHIEVKCGPGTYIRALARDIGTALGCGAHIAALRRIKSGRFTVEQAVTLKQLDASFAEGTEQAWLYPLDIVFGHLPRIQLDPDAARRLAMGQSIDILDLSGAGSQARAYGPNDRFIALVKQDPHSPRWKPVKVFAEPNDVL